MSVFAAIVDGGSLSAAGRRLNVPLATVSRKLADLEAHLKTRLITRSTRKLVLTDAGRDYLDACRQILEQVDEAERAAVGGLRQGQGPARRGCADRVRPPARGAGGRGLPGSAPRGRHPAAPGRPQRQPHRRACRRGPAHRRLAGQQPRRDAGGHDPSRGVCEPGLPRSGSARRNRWSDLAGAPMHHLRRPGGRDAHGPSPTPTARSGRRACARA